MTEEKLSLETSLKDLGKQDWLASVEAIVDTEGYVQQLGSKHNAIFLEEGTTLLVSFETLQGIQVLSDLAQPLGWDLLQDHGWSSLCVLSDGDTWFRDEAAFAYFDHLSDEGFFDEFETVVFYGAGPCAYAAAAFSVASPGAKVVAIQPQATLDPRIIDWDDRFPEMRRHDFNSRYGYAPDMLDAAAQAFVIYDQREQLDAMHAALFTRPNVTKLRMRFMGDSLQTDMLEMDILSPLLVAAAQDHLNDAHFAKLYRARRDYRTYLINLLIALEKEERNGLIEPLCANVIARLGLRRFKIKLRNLRGTSDEDQD